MVACRECGLYWEASIEPVRSAHSDHHHRVYEVHRHLDQVVLPDGTTVTAASFDPEDPYSRDPQPNFGLYLDRRWQPPWDHGHIEWPDFGLPVGTDAVCESLGALLDRPAWAKGSSWGVSEAMDAQARPWLAWPS